MLVEKIQVFTLEIREHSKNMQRRPYKATCFLQECIKKKNLIKHTSKVYLVLLNPHFQNTTMSHRIEFKSPEPGSQSQYTKSAILWCHQSTIFNKL